MRLALIRDYARFGTWPPYFVIPSEMYEEGRKARAFYLEQIKPVEDRSTWSEWGLVPPPDVEPRPTFPPFVLELPQGEETSTATESVHEYTNLARLPVPAEDDPEET